MSLTEKQVALLLETIQKIEQHLATIATAAQEQARLAAQEAIRPYPPR